MNYTITEVRNTLKGLHRPDEAEDQISDLEDKKAETWVKSRNMYIKDTWRRTVVEGTECGRGMGRAGESNGGKMETTVTEQQ